MEQGVVEQNGSADSGSSKAGVEGRKKRLKIPEDIVLFVGQGFLLDTR